MAYKNNYNKNIYNGINRYNIAVEKVDLETFNKIYKETLDLYDYVDLTPSGGLCTRQDLPLFNYSVEKNKNNIILFRRDPINGAKAYKFQNADAKKQDDILPTVAFNMFIKECKDCGLNMDKYKIDKYRALELKKQLTYIIKIFDPKTAGITFEGNVYHIDFHSSFPSGLVNTHPEFRPVVEKFYNQRKENKIYKSVLNYTIGYMQSKYCDYQYTSLAADAIFDNNKRIIDLTNALLDDGLTPLLFNTDGIWYCGDHKYAGPGEGPNICQWGHDYVNVQKFRIKSSGAYEFIDENGAYHPVLRGHTKLDMIKPRDTWEWGDVMKASTIFYEWDDNQGIVTKEGIADEEE